MKILGIELPLKDLEKIYNEFAKKWKKWLGMMKQNKKSKKPIDYSNISSINQFP